MGDIMAKSHLKLVTPASVNRTVAPLRRPNKQLRTREHLDRKEVERLMKAAGNNRHGHRDATMILIAFRHGLRASEVCDLRWDQVDFAQAVLHVRRVKNGTPATHPLTGLEMRALRRLKREAPDSPFMFVSERGAPFSTAGFARMLERAAVSAGLDALKIHPHMLRHACGYALAKQGIDTRALQAYLGHRHIQNTVRYTELAPDRFKGFWKD
jgi:type 1 fimbriae regulatory protein FimB/type 1 fimbriae regulatory protein FimE